MPGTYYNEFDRHANGWLRELGRSGLVPEGWFDGRDIKEVSGEDVEDFGQCHFFAGVGGWAEALRLAGWPERLPVWTGSCPCQPYSCAGLGLGDEDPRNLWPEFRRLIGECLPPVVFGEQTASKAGRSWLAGVRADLEGLGYAVGAADLCAAGAGEVRQGRVRRGGRTYVERVIVGAPHLRQRLYWGAVRLAYFTGVRRGQGRADQPDGREAAEPTGLRPAGRVADARGERRQRRAGEQGSGRDEAERGEAGRDAGDGLLAGRLGDTDRPGQQARRVGRQPGGEGPERALQPGPPIAVGDADGPGREGHGAERQLRQGGGEHQAGRPGRHGFWSDFDVLPCRDDKARRVERGTFPLVDGVSTRMVRRGHPGAPIDPQATPEARVSRLRGYGNAIVPQIAAVFVRELMASVWEAL